MTDTNSLHADVSMDMTDTNSLCIVCLDQPRAVRFYECGHSHTCALCTLKLIGRSGTELACPTCKAKVDRIEVTGEVAQPEYVQGGTGGVSVEAFVDAHVDSEELECKEAAVAASAALRQPRAPGPSTIEREHEVLAHELTGCWINLCAVPCIVPCSLYWVLQSRGRRSTLDLDVMAIGFCCCFFPLPVKGQYRRNNHYEELRYEHAGGSLAAQHLVVKSRTHMMTNVGGRMYKLSDCECLGDRCLSSLL